MIYIDENGNELQSVDLARGWMRDAAWVDHPAQAQTGHFAYEPLPGGGRVQRFIVDTPHRAARREVTAQMYIPYTQAELDALSRGDYGARMDALEENVQAHGEALGALIGGAADA